MAHFNHKNHRNHPNHGFGFTIAEMILVLGIMAILAAVGGRTYLNERDRFEFNNALTKTMQLVKTVRNYATTSYPIYIKGSEKNVIPKGGYGLYFKWDKVRGASTITVFANLGIAPNYQEDDGKNTFDPAVDQVLETYTLPQQIDFRYFVFSYYDNGSPPKLVINDIKWKEDKDHPENTGPTAKEATLLFKPPLGDVSLNDNASQSLTELGLEFQNPASDATPSKKCQRIIINQVKKFPELMYESKC